MDGPLCKLTLVYPPAVEDTLVDMLLSSEPPLYGFTTWAADGHGLDFSKASANERVRGRVQRCVLILVMHRERVPGLIESLRATITVPGLAYWIEPVEAFQRIR